MRIIFDISTVARRSGVPGGIGRVERELANYALAQRPDIEFSFYDPLMETFRRAAREWMPELIGTNAILDTSRLPRTPAHKRKLRFRLPRLLQSAAFWILRFRRNLRVAVERVRMTSSSPRVRQVAAWVLRLIVPSRFKKGASGISGYPTILPYDMAIGEAFDLGPDCILVSAGNDWSYKNIDHIAVLKARCGFRYVVLCHDLILIQFPELVGTRASEFVRNYWEAAFRLSDLIICTSRKVEDDVRAFCQASGIPLGSTALVPLGADPASFHSAAESPLPAGVERDRYILFVSSLEARKGHDLLIRVWNKLVEDRIPQGYGFKLVFVGEFVFNALHLKDHLVENAAEGTLLHFSGVEDSKLATFYRNAAFCVFPSRYEGFGLPVVEAFSFGKAVIASTGGSIPEIVAGLSPCLDPDGDDAWYAEIKRWITDPSRRAYFENKIRNEFRTLTWHEASQSFFDVIDAWGSSRSNQPKKALPLNEG
jgi:glycosyltransferase involved in cell wall biosynthesis